MYCLTLIVKNSGPIIYDALNSWKNVVNYYCILDTGSNDDTIEYINKFKNSLKFKNTFKLFKSDFKGFSKSRNECIKLAENHFKNTKYFIMIDDSYVLVDNKDHSLLEQLNIANSLNHKLIAYNVKNNNVVHPRKMIFTKGHRFHGDIHEDIPEINDCLIHYVYIQDVKNDYHIKRTHDRMFKDICILKKDTKKLRNIYYIGVSYFILKQYDSSIHWFKNSINYDEKSNDYDDECICQSYFYLIETYRCMENYDKCFKYSKNLLIFINNKNNQILKNRLPEIYLIFYYLTGSNIYINHAYNIIKNNNFKIPHSKYSINYDIYLNIIPDEYKKINNIKD